jgi:hypothetical protein
VSAPTRVTPAQRRAVIGEVLVMLRADLAIAKAALKEAEDDPGSVFEAWTYRVETVSTIVRHVIALRDARVRGGRSR